MEMLLTDEDFYETVYVIKYSNVPSNIMKTVVIDNCDGTAKEINNNYDFEVFKKNEWFRKKEDAISAVLAKKRNHIKKIKTKLRNMHLTDIECADLKQYIDKLIR